MMERKQIILMISVIAMFTIVILISSVFVSFMITPLDGGGGGGEDEEDIINPYLLKPGVPFLKIIIPNPSVDGNIKLQWDKSNNAIGYSIYRSRDNGVWIHIGTIFVLEFSDKSLGDGIYRYKIKSFNLNYESDYSNIQSVTVNILGDEPEPEPEGYAPTHPSILINNGSSVTDSQTITLTLSVINGDEMCFHKFLPEDGWTEWEPYSKTKKITLPLDSHEYPNYRIAVKFRNEYGESDDVFADITLELPEEPPTEPVDTSIPSNFDDIILYTLIGTTIFCVSLISIYIYFKKVRTRGV